MSDKLYFVIKLKNSCFVVFSGVFFQVSLLALVFFVDVTIDVIIDVVIAVIFHVLWSSSNMSAMDLRHYPLSSGVLTRNCFPTFGAGITTSMAAVLNLVIQNTFLTQLIV